MSVATELPADMPPRPTMRLIQRMAADRFGFTVDDLTSQRRNRELVTARQVAVYLCRSMTQNSTPAIAACFGHRDHTTILHSCRTIEARVIADRAFGDTVNRLREKIEASLAHGSDAPAPTTALDIAERCRLGRWMDVTPSDVRTLAEAYAETAKRAEPQAETSSDPVPPPMPEPDRVIVVTKTVPVPYAAQLEAVFEENRRLQRALYTPGEAVARERVIAAVERLSRAAA